MKNELKESLLKLVNYQMPSFTRSADFRDGLNMHLLPRRRGEHGWGMSFEVGKTKGGIYSCVTWTLLDSGRALLGSFDKGPRLRPFREEYIEIEHFFTDIHHPTDDELGLLSVVHPWAPPAILLLGEGLEYL